jgi:teichuronic acid biosynthesis glycosyltransferase TuaC
LGTGPNPPEGESVLVNRSVEHGEVPEWLSAADVFVLPSTWEGSCNAILEAMACGLPVIAADGAFNDEILNEEVSIRVDPMDVGAIRRAVAHMRDSESLRVAMGAAALVWSSRFDTAIRAKAMLEFMERWRHTASDVGKSLD